MQIYLAKPGGRKDGPYAIEKIQRDLAEGRYRDSEFWVWHEGLPNWMPLYELPGLYDKPVAPKPAPAAPAPAKSAPAVSAPAVSEPAKPVNQARPASKQNTTTFSARKRTPVAAAPQPQLLRPADRTSPSDDASGLPFAALEQIFVFTTGEGRAVFESAEVTERLQSAVGQDFGTIRGSVFVDVIGRVDVGFDLMVEGTIPEKAWRAMNAIRPFMTQKAKEGSYQICIRPFSIENHDSVALFLLYDREKCECATV